MSGKTLENIRKPSLGFHIMALSFKVRDLLRPRRYILAETGMKAGNHVLDYGCGPGSYVLPSTKLFGSNGMFYALDINPLAIEAVQRIVKYNSLTNVRTILSACDTKLPAGSIDLVLLYDILHDLENRDKVLEELYRVLKNEGVLSVSDHHLEKSDIVLKVTKTGLFKLRLKNKMTLSFKKDER